jgi:hypothetical protein
MNGWGEWKKNCKTEIKVEYWYVWKIHLWEWEEELWESLEGKSVGQGRLENGGK